MKHPCECYCKQEKRKEQTRRRNSLNRVIHHAFWRWVFEG